MARPGDWSALGLDGDPTPGDADRIYRVIAAEKEFVDLARDIDNGLTEIKNTSSQIFIGKTADAMRGVIDGNLRNYISTFKKAHEDVRTALTVYVGVMRTEQRRADAALTAAAALSEDDDAGRATHKATAEDARKILAGAADTAARALNAAAESIASPVDECEEFWKALGWIAMILVLPAMIFGGALALLTIALGVALLIKTAIDFAHGKAGVTELILGVLGVIAPTTKGLHLGNLWKVIKVTGNRGIAGSKNLFLGGPNSFGLFGRVGLGIDSAVGAAGSWIRGGLQGLKLGPAITRVPEIVAFGGNFGRGVRVFPIAAELTVINLAGAKTFFGLRSVITTVNAFKGLANGLSGFKSLRLFLPVAADEMGEGLGLAFRIGFIDRGMFNMYRYGAFIDGKFIGAGAKISGGVNAGFTAFAPGGDVVKLPHVGVGGIGSVHVGPIGHTFDMPPLSGRFTGGLGNVPMVHVPGLGVVGGGFHAGTFPGLNTFTGTTGNLGELGAIAPLTGFGGKIADIPSFSFSGLGTANLGSHLAVPPGITGLGTTAPTALPGALGHVSIPNLGTVTHALPRVELGLPGSGALVHDLPTAGSVALPHVDGVGTVALPHVDGIGTVALPQLGHVAVPQTGTVAMPNATVSALPQAHLPSVSTTPVPGVSGSPTPGLGHTAGAMPTPAVGDLKLPTVGAQLADLPGLTPTNLAGPRTVGGADGTLAHVPEVGSVPITSQIQAPTVGAAGTTHIGVNGSQVTLGNLTSGHGLGHVTPVGVPGGATVGGMPEGGVVGVPGTGAVGGPPGTGAVGGVRTGGAHVVPSSPAGNDITVFMVNNVRYDFAHTFGGIPGLNGVEVRVLPSTRAGHTVDIDVRAGGRTDIDAFHLTVGEQQVLRIEQTLPGGGVHRWDYELNASNTHRLLDDQVIDAEVTGPVPGQSVELTAITSPAPAGGLTGSTTVGNGTGVPPVHGTGGTASPGAHLVEIPGLPHTRLEVRLVDGGVDGVRVVGAADGPGLRTTPGTGAGGSNIVRVEQDVVPNVETRRWDFEVSADGGRLVGIERRFTLSGGADDGTLVVVRVDVADEPLGVTHINADGSVRNPGGPPVRFNAAGINIPTADGFRLHDPATGALSHTGLRLFGSDGNPLPLHVLTPNGGGPRTLVDARATATLGAVTTPAHANGMLHVVPTGTGPVVRVFGADGRFSHDSLPLTRIDGLGLPGGHIRSPHGDTPHVAGPDGRVVPGTEVIPQLGNEFRVVHADGQFHVDAGGARGHDVVPLATADGAGTGLHVFTPVAGVHPLPHPRGIDGTPSTTATVTRVDNTFHVTGIDGRPHVVAVHTPQGVFSHTALPLTGGGAPGGFIRLPDHAGGPPHLTRGDGTIVPLARVTPQQGGGYLVKHGDAAILVDDAGRHTHNVVQLTANGEELGRFVHTPIDAPNAPVPHPHTRGGVPDPDRTITRIGGELRLTDPDGSFAVHGLDGMRRYEAIHLPDGGPFGGRFVRFDNHAATLVDTHLVPVPDTHVVRQTELLDDGFRIVHGTDHVVVGLRGAHRFDAVALRGPDGAPTGEFVFRHPAPTAGGPAPGPLPLAKNAAGHNIRVEVAGRPDGTLRVVDDTSIRVFSGTGEFDFRVLRLTDAAGTHLAQNIRVHPGGARTVVDDDLAAVPDLTVHTRDGGGFHLRGTDGGFRLFDRTGRLDLVATPQQVAHGEGHISVLTVADGAGAHRFDVIKLSDGQLTDPARMQLLRTTGGDLRVLDGNLEALPNLRATTQPGGGYRVDGIGVHTNEFRRFDAGGRLEFQRVDIVGGRGAIDPNRHFEISYPAGGDPTWSLVKTDAHGVPVPGPATRPWFEGGTVDVQGAEVGRVHLVSHLKVTVFERRPLPDGNMLDAHHTPATQGDFGLFNQRGKWAEFGPNGDLIQHGTRHWGESTRSWFDVKSVFGFDVRVRHFQMSADGGHVLAKLDNVPATQGFADTTWVRFDADFRPIASGTRHWGPGRGWTDRTNHPITGEPITVQEKFGRFQFGLHDVRRFHQIELGPDGVPKRDFVSRHPDGNVNGFGKTLHNGDFLQVVRFAEQRPPVFFRNLFSAEIRATDLTRHPWLAKDDRLRVATWTQEPAGGGVGGSRGVQFTTNNKTVIDVASNGDIVRETRTLPNGDTLTVGNVQLPAVHAGPNAGTPVPHRPGYLPWSESVGGLRGHRTHVPTDFVPTPGAGEKQITWQDRVTTDPEDGDWYTPGAKDWTVVRTGFADGTFIDYRPRPNDGAGGVGPNTRTSIDAGNGNWTMYDHHGVVLGRSDSFPDPNGAGRLDIVGTIGANTRVFRWHDAAHPEIGGVRITSFERQISAWQWDRESFQDFDADGRLIRDHRLLGEGLTVDAWRGVDARGNEVWHWNKMDANNNVLTFGTGVDDRIRHWFDADGNALPGWAKGARWSDRITGLDDRVVQEIPAPKTTNMVRDYFTDTPFRVRDYTPTPTTEFNRHIWQESDHGIHAQVKVRLSDGTFLETNAFNKHGRRYDTDGVTLVNDRSIPGYITEFDAHGVGTIVGRETHFTGWINEYRGLNRTFREANRWNFGPSVDGEAVPAPFALRAIQSIGIDMTHEFLLDFTVNLVVLSIVRVMSGSGLSAVDVGRAAFGAALSSMTKGTVAAAHMSANRGGWKVYWSNIDYGMPGSWRPNDDSWNTEFGANERPVRWRGGTYEFALGLGTGAVGGFVSGASQAALFGVRGADGAIIKLTGQDAVLSGLASVVGGLLDTVSVGALRTLVQHTIGSRWIHRQGPMDIFVIGAIGKLVDKLFSLTVLGPATIRWIGDRPDVHSGDNLLPGTGTGGG
ncbi:hypothetical protein [Embleya sp. NPDC050493]|uniref:hypothetical protein n=1 Tax=Embleya sp. NPDC050493 TaxID=3363989 RepID=UPI0037BDE671